MDDLRILAGNINDFLFSLGFSPCPAGVMAHKNEMNKSYTDWVDTFLHWINTPDPKALMKATIFFDLRTIYGNVEMTENLKNKIIDEIRRKPSFLNFMAKNAIENPPPLSFFNQFMVESSGEHKNEFDIKARAIMPLTDAARVLALEHGFFESTNTSRRFRLLSEMEPENKDLFNEARMGIDYLHKTRAMAGLQHGHSGGRFISISSFNKMDRKILKEIFNVISEIQKLLRVRYQLDYFRS
jgi:CBS domain-containing protein